MIRTKADKIRDRNLIMNFYFQNFSIAEIGKKVKERTEANYLIRRDEILRTIDESILMWKRAEIIKIDQLKERELQKLDLLEQEYWFAWKNSCTPSKQTSITRERGEPVTEVNDEGDVVDTFQFIETKRIEKVTQSHGNPKFLEGIERCIYKRCQIMGIFAIQKPSLMDSDEVDLNPENIDLREVHSRLLSVLGN